MEHTWVITVFVLIALSPLAGAESVQPGWNVIFLGSNVFLGDSINITVTGPLQFNNSTVRIQLIDSGGVELRNYYSVLANGVSYYNYTTSINSTPGVWRVNAYLGEDNLVAKAEVNVIFDEMNYLAKRTTILENQNKHQEEFILRLIKENQNLNDRIDWALILVPVGLVATVIVLLWSIIDVDAPLRQVLLELEKRYGPQTQQKLLKNFETWLLNPDSTSELKQYHLRMRLMNRPNWPADSIAARSVEYAIQHGLATAKPVLVDAKPVAMEGDSLAVKDTSPVKSQKRSKTRVGE
jgi:hypothetical protein